jgi:hypothetical protein
MSHEYRNAQASLTKWVGQIVSDHMFYQQPGQAQPQLVDFDAINDEAQLPAGDLYGLADYSVTNDDETFVVTTRIGISTQGDVNSFRKRDLVDALFDATRPNALIPVHDSETDQLLGQMKVMSGTTVLPVVITQVRTYTYLSLSLSFAVPRQP